MTDTKRKHVTGKGFAPGWGEPDDRAMAATTTSGSGKQFSASVGDPQTDERARRIMGSGKAFAMSVTGADANLKEDAAGGSGKQFRPGRNET